MNCRERLATVLKGDVPDRVPCVPLVYYFAASYADVPLRAFTRSMEAYRRAIDKCFWEIGPWDAMYPLPITMDAPGYHIVWGAGLGVKPAGPDGDRGQAPLFQFASDHSLLGEADYERIHEFGSSGGPLPYFRLFELLVSRSLNQPGGTALWAGYLLPQIVKFVGRWLAEIIRWRLRSVPFFVGFSLEAPFDTLSLARGLKPFCDDLFRREDELEQAVMLLARSYAVVARWACRIVGIKNFLLLVHHSSNHFISPAQYRRFVDPSIRYIAQQLHQDGIIMGLHCDSNWDENLEHMTDLPSGTYFQLDGFSGA